jgi:hypothetical protein
MLQFLGGAIGYVRGYGVSQAARRLWQACVFDRRRIYVTRYDLHAMAQLSIDTSGLEVRLARPDDPIIESFPNLAPSTIATWLSPGYFFFVALHGGQFVAYYCLSTKVSAGLAPFLRLRHDQVFTVVIHTRQEFRRQGLARITRVGVARHLVARGFNEVLATESPTNHPTIVAADRAGLTRLGTLTRTCVLGRVSFWATPATTLEPPLVGRQLKLLRHLAPAVSRVGLLVNPSVVITSPEAEDAARRFAAKAGTDLTLLPVREAVDQAGAFEAALSMARERGVNGLIVLSDPMMRAHRRTLVPLVSRFQLPAVFDAQAFVSAGGLMSCPIPAPVLRDLDGLIASYDMRRGAGHAEASADELNVAVNRSAAATLGLAVPADLQTG